MDKINERLRKIPKVDAILKEEVIQGLLVENHHSFVVKVIQEGLQEYREELLRGRSITKEPEKFICEKVVYRLSQKKCSSLRKVINATGIVLHTNLGRAAFGEKVAEKVKETAMSYSTLEYDVEKGCRGSRHSHVEALLCKLTGAEAGMAVNNNAGAVLIMLSAIARGKEVIVSRGELVEIGGSFRVPVMMEESGAFLREVGTTNKTHPKDYKEAIVPLNTGGLLKVHTSNFAMIGFTEEVSIETLCEIGREMNVPVLQDLGSGSFYNIEDFGLPKEPTVQECLKAGVDVITFSGDKLLGGPQAGIILGKKEYIEAMKKHPLARILRIDKMTLGALEETIRLYLNPKDIMKEIPTLGMLSISVEELRAKGEKLLGMVTAKNFSEECSLIEIDGQVGGGSVPGGILKSIGISIKPKKISLEALEERMRKSEIPIISRIYKEQLILDVRTIFEEDYPYIGHCIREHLK